MPAILIPRRHLFSTFALLVAASAGTSGDLFAAETSGVPKNSPFMPATSGATAVVSVSESIEFAGISSVGKRTDLIFHDKAAKKSRWVGVGETVEGISVVSFDPRRDEAVVKINGVQKTLALRKGSRTASGPAPAPVAVMPPAGGFAVATPPLPLPGAEPLVGTNPTPGQTTAAPAPAAPPVPPAVPAGPATPAQVAKQESDARMLVSDLLEIGMAQRKAYEEAHRRAAQGEAAPAATTPAPAQPGNAPATPTQP